MRNAFFGKWCRSRKDLEVMTDTSTKRKCKCDELTRQVTELYIAHQSSVLKRCMKFRKEKLNRVCKTCISTRDQHLIDTYPHQTKPHSRLRPMPCHALLQAHTMPFPPTFYVVVPYVSLDPTWLGFAQSASRPGTELPPVRAHSPKALRRFRQLECMIWFPFLFSALIGVKNS